jgi:hypothetical protein
MKNLISALALGVILTGCASPDMPRYVPVQDPSRIERPAIIVNPNTPKIPFRWETGYEPPKPEYTQEELNKPVPWR